MTRTRSLAGQRRISPNRLVEEELLKRAYKVLAEDSVAADIEQDLAVQVEALASADTFWVRRKV